jgi:hypothetical protein
MNRLVSAAGFAALLAVGCSPESTGGRLVTVQVSLARADAAASVALAPQDVTAGAVDLSNVATLAATLDSVQLQNSGSQGWQTVKPAIAQPINLLDLPAASVALDLGTVFLEDGACKARLFLTDPQITFTDAVVVGQSTFAAGTPYDVTIPSGPQTGLKADGDCDVPVGGTTVTLAFDGTATVGTIAATGSGSILLSPVIHIVQP